MNVLLNFFKNKDLVYELTKKEFRDRTKSNLLGYFWIFLIPVVQFSIYIFIFTRVLDIKISTMNGEASYALYILSGMIPWLSFTEILSKSTTLIRANASLVKQIVFPIEVLPLKISLAAIITQISFYLFLYSYIAYLGRDAMSICYLAVALLIQFFFYVGVSCLISCLCVFLRDIKEIVMVFLMIGVYCVPILYTTAMVPTWAQEIIYKNPLTHMVLVYQDIFFYGQMVHKDSWIIWGLFSLCVLFLGNRIFSYLKQNFGDFV